MFPIQKILRDPAFWSLLLMNLLLIWYYNGPHGQYTTIVWIYWCQSVLLGVFNFFDMLSLKNPSVDNMSYNGRPMTTGQAKGCLPIFFIIHYGIFHIAYMVFLYGEFGFSGLDIDMLKVALTALFVNQIMLFIQSKTVYAKIPRNIGIMFAVPYIRIVPMHLTVLLPAFLGWEPMLTFLGLKTVLDIASHLISTKYYWTGKSAEQGTYI